MSEKQVSHQDVANPDQYWASALEQVCNFTQAHSGTLILDGYDKDKSVIHWRFGDVRKWATNKAKLAATQGGCSYGDRGIK